MTGPLSPGDACLCRALASHLDPDQGTPFWLDRQRALGFSIRDEVRTTADLPRLGPLDRAQLLERPLLDLLPRRLHDRLPELILAETGGTAGRPLRAVFTPAEFEAGFGTPFFAVSEPRGFPRGGGWLFVGPSGPHVIAQAARLLARGHGALEPFAVDLDPRWARAQTPGSLGSRLYGQHVLDQALDLLAREPIQVLFVTPPLAQELAGALSATARRAIRGIHLGGLAVDGATLAALGDAFPEAVLLPGYGNSLLGILMQVDAPAPRADGGLDLDYYPLAGRLQVSVVREAGGVPRLDEPVAPGEEGRVVLARLDESFLLANLVERDVATRVAAPPAAQALGFAPLGLRNPRPSVAEQATHGLY
jgi:hypothetical protein